MKWIKHLTTSLDDPFIFELIDKFGGDGYLVYFGTVEIMAREFDINNPGICRISFKFLRKKLQLSAKKVSKILQFCEEKQKIFVKIDGDNIELNCPKLKEMADEWTHRKLGSNSGVTPKILNHEVDKDKDIYIPKHYFDLSKKMLEYQEKNLGKNLVTITEEKINAGADAIDKICRLDGFDFETEVKPALQWGCRDAFWGKQLRSPGMLRKKGKNGETKFSNLFVSFKKAKPTQKIKLVY